MTIVKVTGVAPNGASGTAGIDIPPEMSAGDNAIALWQANSATSVFTKPAGWTVIDQLGPLGGNNCQSYLCQKDAPFDGSETGQIVGNFSGTAPRYGVLLALFRDAVLDQAPVGTSDNSADTDIAFGSFTPNADTIELIVFGGITTTSGAGVYTVTPPTGVALTEDVDLNDGFTTQSNVGVWAGRASLSGVAGVTQNIGSGQTTALKNVRMNSWAIPLVPVAAPTTARFSLRGGVWVPQTYVRL